MRATLLRIACCGLAFVWGAVVSAPTHAQETKPSDDSRLPARAVTLLKEKCWSCHGEGKELEGGLDLRTRPALLIGGDSGPAILVGQPKKSLLWQSVRWEGDHKMPPKEANRLKEDEVELLGRWIQGGATWASPLGSTGGATEEGVVVHSTPGLSADWSTRRYPAAEVWAYRPPTHSVPPSGAAHPIDAFVDARLAERGLAAAPPADRRTLARRVAIDLLGLPPSPEEIDALMADDSPDAWPRLIDRLLASPYYGEQQARHWLDVTRYADTSGFSNDYERPQAWRYRDYVVRSFNADKRFDRFVTEQLAGDEIDATDPEMLIAVGFLRMGPWEHTGMSVAAETRQQFLDDATNSVGVTFLGQALRCAGCHDHKFDPVPTRDYYRIQAVFAPVQFAEPGVPFLPSENARGTAEDIARLKRLLADAEQQRRTVQDKSVDKMLQKRIDYLQRELLRYEPLALSVYSGPPNQYTSVKARNELPPRDQRQGEVPPVHILMGGSLASPADVVTPGVLSAVAGSNDLEAPSPWNSVPTTTTGRRLALARWIASPENTLTARVFVNRVWQQHFGRGLVSTANNFGTKGARPTHPELLDWLARWFVEHDWSVKALHHLILTSRTYQRSAEHPDGQRLRELDSKNELLAAYPRRRLAAEELRDGLLTVSGELNRTQGGPPAQPEINWELALQPRHIMGSVAPAYQPSPHPADRHRRTVYALRIRTLPDPLLEVFNRPSADISCDVRDATTVTPQVFGLFNGESSHDRALAVAQRVEREVAAGDARIDRAFRLIYGRSPTADERRIAADHVRKMSDFHRTHPPQPTRRPDQVERSMIEELTGELFRWKEPLDRMPLYQSDAKPWEVEPETRALADLCLVLLNSNEFLYIR